MELISEKTIQLLNYRIQQESHSSRLYYSMYYWLDTEGLSNCASIYKKYAEEEAEHSEWAQEYLLKFNIRPVLLDLPEIESNYANVSEILNLSYSHEVDITNQCKELTKHALEEGDFGLLSLSQKYNEEQVEEVDKALRALDIFKLTTDLLIFDHYMEKFV
jgi:ferritin